MDAVVAATGAGVITAAHLTGCELPERLWARFDGSSVGRGFVSSYARAWFCRCVPLV